MLPYPCGPGQAGAGGLSGLENVFSIFTTSQSIIMSQVVPCLVLQAPRGWESSELVSRGGSPGAVRRAPTCCGVVRQPEPRGRREGGVATWQARGVATGAFLSEASCSILGEPLIPGKAGCRVAWPSRARRLLDLLVVLHGGTTSRQIFVGM